jgi:type IV pilus biogenesis protein CpaD/CtpE
MEQKIRVLVQSIAQASDSVLTSQYPSSSPGLAGAQAAMAKDIAALSRLVQASITALRNANTPVISVPAKR